MVGAPVLFVLQPKERGLRVLLRFPPIDKAGTMLNVEFTIEPFVEGSPGAHVTAAVAAVERCGLSVEFGPFGSSFSVTAEQLPEAIAELMRAAYGNGATYVSVDVGVA
jgi:uncharacterized protein YqgV (UPF0045/DUF77 family)